MVSIKNQLFSIPAQDADIVTWFVLKRQSEPDQRY